MDRHQATFTPAATPVPGELVAAADAVGVRVQRLYGSTEMLAATWHPADAALGRRMHPDGHPVPNVDVEIRDVSGRLCGRGETGEIYARSPGTAVGYFDDPERTSATFVADGWIRSGDLGVFDDDGDLRVVGRVKEIVIRGGLNISPREIEDMLMAFEEVERAAVVGLPDARLGERCCACVVLAPGFALDMATMVERLQAAGLAKYRLPERLVALDALPMTATGKVQKHVIVAELLNRS